MSRIVLQLALVSASSVHADLYQADRAYRGEARDPGSGALLYTEDHLLHALSISEDGASAIPRHRLVSYRCPDGRLFARKSVECCASVNGNLAAPAFELEDGRFGYREGARFEGGQVRAFSRREAGTEQRHATIEDSEDLVIDAGFDQYVQEHWDALQRGEVRRIDFLVPSRLETLAFKLKRVGATTLADAPASMFRLSLGGVLGWFAPDIEVSYRDADRRLMRFEGMTNIRADREQNLSARIDFPPARERRDVTPAEWDAARAEPLTDCEPGR